jgi:hypothetical protein
VAQFPERRLSGRDDQGTAAMRSNGSLVFEKWPHFPAKMLEKNPVSGCSRTFETNVI